MREKGRLGEWGRGRGEGLVGGGGGGREGLSGGRAGGWWALTQDPVLRQRAVAHGVGGLVGPEVVHGNAGSLVHVLVVQHVVAMAEAEQHR